MWLVNMLFSVSETFRRVVHSRQHKDMKKIKSKVCSDKGYSHSCLTLHTLRTRSIVGGMILQHFGLSFVYEINSSASHTDKEKSK